MKFQIQKYEIQIYNLKHTSFVNAWKITDDDPTVLPLPASATNFDLYTSVYLCMESLLAKKHKSQLYCLYYIKNIDNYSCKVSGIKTESKYGLVLHYDVVLIFTEFRQNRCLDTLCLIWSLLLDIIEEKFRVLLDRMVIQIQKMTN